MKPIIGIMPLWDDEKNSIWMLPGYLDGISRAGGVSIILPLLTERNDLKQLMDLCDGFLFTGGHDVSPEIYSEPPMEGKISCCRKRDEMETFILKEAIESNKPVLGICRGIQFINAYLGGTLYQDIPTQFPSDTEHHQDPPYDIPVHTVDIVPDTPLHCCLGIESLAVNSYHHQAVKEIASGLVTMAVSSDGLIEAFYMPSHRFLWAVQWHPEFSYISDSSSMKVFSAFVEASTTNMA
ncbi:MAG: gamma-glutamyl-gamma-aminobutyrate hydrolase family protein [Lachnospiraceae bacterium]|nr:gamma-glutamyl-gamma-aminobutyrate hydrolase family protein [Lachnospiraceae bacterium]